jgi:hypothetical protein
LRRTVTRALAGQIHVVPGRRIDFTPETLCEG